MSEFRRYRRSKIAELRDVTQADIDQHLNFGGIYPKDSTVQVSISSEDLKMGSPHLGDKIARNPLNHRDQWLVAGEYFKENFEVL